MRFASRAAAPARNGKESEKKKHTARAGPLLDKNLIVVRTTGAEEPLPSSRDGKGDGGPAEPTASSKLQLCRNYRGERIVRGEECATRLLEPRLVARAPFHRLRPCGGITSSAG